MIQTIIATPQQPISNRLTSLVWFVEGCFFPCLGINEGRLGLAGGLGLSSPLLDARFGESSVADVMEGLSCEYDAVDPTVKLFGLRLACIFLKLLVAWLSILSPAQLYPSNSSLLHLDILGPMLMRAASVPMTRRCRCLGRYLSLQVVAELGSPPRFLKSGARLDFDASAQGG